MRCKIKYKKIFEDSFFDTFDKGKKKSPGKFT